MIYSVWNQSKKAYDYYATQNGNDKVNSPAPKHIPNKKLGATLQQAAWPLPSNARLIGSGDIAKGRVAQRRGLAGLGDSTGGIPTVVWGALLVWGIFTLWTQSKS